MQHGARYICVLLFVSWTASMRPDLRPQVVGDLPPLGHHGRSLILQYALKNELLRTTRTLQYILTYGCVKVGEKDISLGSAQYGRNDQQQSCCNPRFMSGLGKLRKE